MKVRELIRELQQLASCGLSDAEVMAVFHTRRGVFSRQVYLAQRSSICTGQDVYLETRSECAAQRAEGFEAVDPD